MEGESWRRNPGGGILEEAPRRHPGGSQETPRRLPGGSQEAPRGRLGCHGWLEVSWREHDPKPLCFTVESGATDHFA